MHIIILELICNISNNMIKSVIIDSNGTHNLRWSANGQVAGAGHEQNPSAATLQPTPTPRIRSNMKPRGYDIGEVLNLSEVLV